MQQHSLFFLDSNAHCKKLENLAKLTIHYGARSILITDRRDHHHSVINSQFVKSNMPRLSVHLVSFGNRLHDIAFVQLCWDSDPGFIVMHTLRGSRMNIDLEGFQRFSAFWRLIEHQLLLVSSQNKFSQSTVLNRAHEFVWQNHCGRMCLPLFLVNRHSTKRSPRHKYLSYTYVVVSVCVLRSKVSYPSSSFSLRIVLHLIERIFCTLTKRRNTFIIFNYTFLIACLHEVCMT